MEEKFSFGIKEGCFIVRQEDDGEYKGIDVEFDRKDNAVCQPRVLFEKADGELRVLVWDGTTEDYNHKIVLQTFKKHRKAVNIEWDLDDLIADGYDPSVVPTEIDIPDDMVDEDRISDYLSEQSGLCHLGFKIVEE